MKTKESVFMFIAKKLERIGQPEDDSAGSTIYGISKRWHPADFVKMRNAIKSDNFVIVKNAILDIYSSLYEKSIAPHFNNFYPLNFNIFDMSFNMGEDDAVWCWQKTYNEIVNPAHLITIDGEYGSQTANSIAYLQCKTKEDYVIYNNFYALERMKRYNKKSPRKDRCGLVNRVIKLQEWILKG